MRKKGMVLAIVIGVLMVIFTLALVAMHLMTQEARVAEHKIKRMRAVFAARAGMIHALEEIRNGNDPTTNNWKPGGDKFGKGIAGYGDGLSIKIDYHWKTTPPVDPLAGTGPLNTNPIDITVKY